MVKSRSCNNNQVFCDHNNVRGLNFEFFCSLILKHPPNWNRLIAFKHKLLNNPKSSLRAHSFICNYSESSIFEFDKPNFIRRINLNQRSHNRRSCHLFSDSDSNCRWVNANEKLFNHNKRPVFNCSIPD